MSTVGPDVELWLAWKTVGETLRTRVLSDVLAVSPLGEAELTVLALLDQAGGSMRQNALAVATGWDRTRLSHLVSRMQQRGYLDRERLRNGVLVTVLDGGTDALAATRGPLEAAVRRHVTARLDDGLRDAIRAVTEAFVGPGNPTTPALGTTLPDA